jgi:hypothetical protein
MHNVYLSSPLASWKLYVFIIITISQHINDPAFIYGPRKKGKNSANTILISPNVEIQ